MYIYISDSITIYCRTLQTETSLHKKEFDQNISAKGLCMGSPTHPSGDVWHSSSAALHVDNVACGCNNLDAEQNQKVLVEP